MSCRGFLQCLCLRRIPVVIIHIDNFRFIIFFVVNFFRTFYGKLRLRNRHDELVPYADDRILIFDRFVHGDQIRKRKRIAFRDTGQRITGYDFIDLFFLLLFGYFLDRILQRSDLVILQISFHDFYRIAEVDRLQSQFIIVKIFFHLRLYCREDLIELRIDAGRAYHILFFLRRRFFLCTDSRRQNIQFTVGIHDKVNVVFSSRIILAQRCLQKREHFFGAGKIDRILVNLHRIGTVQCFFNIIAQNRRHVIGYDTIVIYFSPQHFLPFVSDIRISKYHFVTGTGDPPARLNQTGIESVQISYDTDLLAVHINRKHIITGVLQFLIMGQKKCRDHRYKRCTFNICNFHFFIMSAYQFHKNNHACPFSTCGMHSLILVTNS